MPIVHRIVLCVNCQKLQQNQQANFLTAYVTDLGAEMKFFCRKINLLESKNTLEWE